MRTVIGLLGVALVVGCAQPQKQTTSPPKEESKWVLKQPPADAGTSKPAAAASSKVADPNTFMFEKMSVTLSDAEKARVAALVDKAKAASTLSIRGYCDRSEVGNAKDAAIARATAVRNELVSAGVALGKIRIRYTTEEARHAAVVEFQ
ncbi:hypothetical protein N8I74_14735 [Chitiniphilus purpureus]|uniref:OmpA-like domain-containing protein n=1 Tax=Chitiniphilus purpureus TaxID=2981137 RepID=A0ABY6DJM9_9NEIS|nr:hypothetical protein [Chitiniphilus sp. CD1]UXY14566.1 hypothetical protein N8I74_14735 [Chitiniphilus sp. CD1]